MSVVSGHSGTAAPSPPDSWRTAGHCGPGRGSDSELVVAAVSGSPGASRAGSLRAGHHVLSEPPGRGAAGPVATRSDSASGRRPARRSGGRRAALPPMIHDSVP
eukprot:532040-Hanusia_phi.AAC.1